MPRDSTYPEQQSRMSYQPAKLDRAQGFAVAHLERKHEGGELVVTGTFKGERSFFQKHSHTSQSMTFKGAVEHEGVIYYAEVRVQVEIQVRQAKFSAVRPPTVWQRITET